jgi:hypothetical protein
LALRERRLGIRANGGDDALRAERRHVAYAAECNPHMMGSNEVWSVKQETWGGDDGVEFLQAEQMRGLLVLGQTLQIEMTPKPWRCSASGPRRPRRDPAELAGSGSRPSSRSGFLRSPGEAFAS